MGQKLLPPRGGHSGRRTVCGRREVPSLRVQHLAQPDGDDGRPFQSLPDSPLPFTQLFDSPAQSMVMFFSRDQARLRPTMMQLRYLAANSAHDVLRRLP